MIGDTSISNILILTWIEVLDTHCKYIQTYNNSLNNDNNLRMNTQILILIRPQTLPKYITKAASIYLFIEMNFYKFSKSTAIIVANSLCISKCF
jgi:CMP-N-acetylneuraminic acid synthetase